MLKKSTSWPHTLSRRSLWTSALLAPLGSSLMLLGCSGEPDESPSPSPEITPTSVPITPTAVPITPTPKPDPTPTPTPEPTPEPTPTATPEPPKSALENPVQVHFDSTGMPHIFAKNDHDVFFTQGYLAARDRLFQLDLTRRQALGRLTEVYGEGSLGNDVVVRGFKPLEHAASEYDRWLTVYPRQVGWAEAYAAGVNAFIDDAKAGRNNASLPDEYAALDLEPEYLNLTQLLAMDYMFAVTLGTDPLLELTITLIQILVGEEAFSDLLRTMPIEPASTIPDSQKPLSTRQQPLEKRSLTAGDLQHLLEKASTLAPPESGRAKRALDPLNVQQRAQQKGPGFDPELKAQLSKLAQDPVVRDQIRDFIRRYPLIQLWDTSLGSNAWAVASENTTTGGALLAGDTHMGLSLPTFFNQVHLNTTEAGGDIDAAGVVAAGGPGLIIGTNGKIGWSITTNMMDNCDLFLERPTSDGSGIRINGETVPFEIWNETYQIRLSDGTYENRKVEMRRTEEHGQVLPNEILGLPAQLMISLKWAGEREGTVIGTLYEFMLSQDLDDMRVAMDHHTLGAGNFVMADINGDVAYDPRTSVPLRQTLELENPPWLALPGTGGYEWTGFLDLDEVPHIYRPTSGIISSANNDGYGNTLDGNPLNDEYYIGAIYDSGMRAHSINMWLREKLSSGQKISPEMMGELQAYTYEYIAEHMVPFLLEAATRRPDLVSEAESTSLDYLRSWDYKMEPDSIGASIYAAWWLTAVQEVFEDELDPALFDSLTGDVAQYYARPMIFFLHETAEYIDQLDAGTASFPSQSGLNFFDDQETSGVVETRDEMLLRALDRAVAHLTSLAGDQQNTWRWDRFHTLNLSNGSERWLEEELDRGPYPMGGSSYTVLCTEGGYYRDGQPVDVWDVRKASSIRMVLDFSGGTVKMENVIPGGQSERVDSPYYDDQIDLWVGNERREIPLTRTEVEADSDDVWNLAAGWPNP